MNEPWTNLRLLRSVVVHIRMYASVHILVQQNQSWIKTACQKVVHVVATLSFNAKMDLANLECNLKTGDNQKWPSKRWRIYYGGPVRGGPYLVFCGKMLIFPAFRSIFYGFSGFRKFSLPFGIFPIFRSFSKEFSGFRSFSRSRPNLFFLFSGFPQICFAFFRFSATFLWLFAFPPYILHPLIMGTLSEDPKQNNQSTTHIQLTRR